MWIIRTALRYPYTFFVLAIVIVLFGSLAGLRTPVDILPDIKLPVISVVWTYIGMPPADMSNRIITYYERQMTTAVTDIDHIESQSLPGVGVVKVFFHPDVNVNAALSEVIGISQTVLKRLPPASRRRRSSATTPPACRYCSWRCRARRSRISSCTTCPTTSSARGSPKSRAPPCLRPTAARTARCRSISIRRRCTRRT